MSGFEAAYAEMTKNSYKYIWDDDFFERVEREDKDFYTVWFWKDENFRERFPNFEKFTEWAKGADK